MRLKYEKHLNDIEWHAKSRIVSVSLSRNVIGNLTDTQKSSCNCLAFSPHKSATVCSVLSFSFFVFFLRLQPNRKSPGLINRKVIKNTKYFDSINFHLENQSRKKTILINWNVIRIFANESRKIRSSCGSYLLHSFWDLQSSVQKKFSQQIYSLERQSLNRITNIVLSVLLLYIFFSLSLIFSYFSSLFVFHFSWLRFSFWHKISSTRVTSS